MSERRAPSLDTRRARDFERELIERARAWIPEWGIEDNERDFGRALLRVAARFGSEVAERLDRGGEKMKRGLLDWLAVRGEAARPARMPVVFRLVPTAPAAVRAEAGTRMQLEVGGLPVVFETEKEVRLVPGRMAQVVGANPSEDAFMLPPPGLHSLDPLVPLPSQWLLKSFAAPDAATLQLDPALGLEPGMVIEIGGAQHVVAQVKEDLVTIEPKLADPAGYAAGTAVKKVTFFHPFDGARNRQEHVLYLGHPDLLNIEARALVDVVGTATLGADVTWEYWGKATGASDPAWVPLEDKSADHARNDEAIVLEKPAGAIEPAKVGKNDCRWIRARKVKAEGAAPKLSTDGLKLRINTPKAGPLDPLEPMPGATPPAEIIVNTAPSPPRDFYPLGREPRMFDTLYIGSKEAFSKPGARARVRFDLAEPVFDAMAFLPYTPAGRLVAAVDKSGSLNLLAVKADGSLKALRPPTRPASGSAEGAKLSRPEVRPAIWTVEQSLRIAVAAGATVSIWRENPLDPSSSTWEAPPPDLPDPVNPQATIDAVIAVKESAPVPGAPSPKVGLLALREKSLYWLAEGGAWTALTLTQDGASAAAGIAAIAPALDEFSREPSERFIAVFENGDVCVAAPLEITAVAATSTTPATDELNLETQLNGCHAAAVPCGMRRADGTLEIVALSSTVDTVAGPFDVLLASRRAPAATAGTPGTVTTASASLAEYPLDQQDISQFDAEWEAGTIAAYLRITTTGGEPLVLAWMPFHPAPALANVVFAYEPDPALGKPAGSISVAANIAFLPGKRRGEILAMRIHGERRGFTAAVADFKSAVAIRLPLPLIDAGDKVIIRNAGAWKEVAIAALPDGGIGEFADQATLWLDERVDGTPQPDDVFLWPQAAPQRNGTKTGASTFQLAAGDGARRDDMLRVEVGGGVEYLLISDISPTREATLADPLSPGPNARTYHVVPRIDGRVVPALDLGGGNDNWQRSVLEHGNVYFPILDPVRQRVIAADEATSDPTRPSRLAFDSSWTTGPTGALAIAFAVDGAVTAWLKAMADTSANPALAWEYWNGTGWWRLETDAETTNNLKNSGHVVFTVPADLRETDWAGKKNYWIRARLVGGDYGRENVVLTSTVSGTTTTQVVNRTTDGIQPPYALDVWVLYDIATAAWPKYLVTQDSGTVRDQSDANRTTGALVEIFTPLSVTLGRLGTNGSQPALYLGFDAQLSGQPVNVLLLVAAERDHDAFAPLEIAALAGDRFVPLVAQDATRALGESGVLSFAFAVPPVASELFGATLSWLRLAPRAAAGASDWKPNLRGAYLNAAWAASTETLTRELLGSSEGAPGASFHLARPPLLRGSLDLRVREPLGEEEREQLDLEGRTPVTTDASLPGLWVRWRRVIDPLDEGPKERVYSLDEDTGEVRFGDGRNGMIPPTGRDAIVAFRYQRTQSGLVNGDVAANGIAPRTPLNLVTPVESVEAVLAADTSAGGAPPEADERVLRFGAARLRHRGRAVTARDFEDIALQSSPRIAQARAFTQGSGLRLVVVMRGADPSPDRARRRELKNLLLAESSPALAARERLVIDGPRVRLLRVALRLRVGTLDDAGDVGDGATARVRSWFDAAVGGRDREGWPLGAQPREEDLALALGDQPKLQGIASIAFEEIAADGGTRPWSRPAQADELAVLATDPVRLEFELVGRPA